MPQRTRWDVGFRRPAFSFTCLTATLSGLTSISRACNRSRPQRRTPGEEHCQPKQTRGVPGLAQLLRADTAGARRAERGPYRRGDRSRFHESYRCVERVGHRSGGRPFVPQVLDDLSHRSRPLSGRPALAPAATKQPERASLGRANREGQHRDRQEKSFHRRILSRLKLDHFRNAAKMVTCLRDVYRVPFLSEFPQGHRREGSRTDKLL